GKFPLVRFTVLAPVRLGVNSLLGSSDRPLRRHSCRYPEVLQRKPKQGPCGSAWCRPTDVCYAATRPGKTRPKGDSQRFYSSPSQEFRSVDTRLCKVPRPPTRFRSCDRRTRRICGYKLEKACGAIGAGAVSPSHRMDFAPAGLQTFS